MPSSEHKKACFWAVTNALLAYALIYFIAIHLLVALKWETTGPDPDQLDVQIVNPPRHEIDAGFGGGSAADRIPAATELLQDMLSQSKQSKEKSVEAAQDLLEEFQTALLRWVKIDSSDAFLEDGSEFNETLALGDLLQLQSLSEIKDHHDIKASSKTITEELEVLMDQKGKVRWSDVQALLSPSDGKSFPPKEKLTADELVESLCLAPVPPEDKDEDTASTIAAKEEAATMSGIELQQQMQKLALYANEDDLEVHFSTIESILDHRSSAPQERLQNNTEVKASLQRSRETISAAMADANDIVENTVDELSGKVAVAASDDDDDDDELGDDTAEAEDAAIKSRKKASGCNAADVDAITDLITAGLDALARHQDLRGELLKALQKLDAASAENLILDADFRMDPDLPMLPIPTDGVTVQRILDSPMLPHLAKGMDRLLDIIGGYNDSLDKYLDHLQESFVDTHNPDASSLGKAFVSSLLVKSGHQTIPIPPKVLQILQQSRGGRAVLASLSY